MGISSNPNYDYRFYDFVKSAEPTQLSADAVGLSRTSGAVFHAFPWLSLGYTQSNNFTPSTTTLPTPLNTSYSNPSGETRDFSANFYFLDNRLSVRLTYFETAASNQLYINGTKYSGGNRILQRLQDNYKAAGDSHFQAMQSLYPVQNTNVPDARDTQATGFELTVVYNPTRQWRIALSGSSNENTLITDDEYAGLYLYTNTDFEGLGTWRKFADELQKVAPAPPPAISTSIPPTAPIARRPGTTPPTSRSRRTARRGATATVSSSLVGARFATAANTTSTASPPTTSPKAHSRDGPSAAISASVPPPSSATSESSTPAAAPGSSTSTIRSWARTPGISAP